MAMTIEIEVPPNTTVVLPDSEVIERMMGGLVSIKVDNQSGEEIGVSSEGASDSFDVATLPAAIADEVEGSLEMDTLDDGSLMFSFGAEDEEVEVQLIEGSSSAAPDLNIKLALIIGGE